MFYPDELTLSMIKWTTRAIVALVSLSLIMLSGAIAVKAVAFLCTSLGDLAHIVAPVFAEINPIVYASSLLIAGVLGLWVCRKFLLGLSSALNVQGGRI
jgi:hypothetical protein